MTLPEVWPSSKFAHFCRNFYLLIDKFHPLIDFLKKCWTRLKLGARNSVQVSQVVGRCPVTWAITCCLQGCVVVGSWNGEWIWGLNPGILIRGMDRTSSILTAVPNIYLLMSYFPWTFWNVLMSEIITCFVSGFISLSTFQGSLCTLLYISSFHSLGCYISCLSMKFWAFFVCCE